jgi:hypothetical protein
LTGVACFCVQNKTIRAAGKKQETNKSISPLNLNSSLYARETSPFMAGRQSVDCEAILALLFTYSRDSFLLVMVKN